MSKIFYYSTIILILSFFLVGSAANAAPNINEFTGNVANYAGYDTAGVTETTISESVGKVIKVVLAMVGTIFLALTVYAGILWMTARGNEEQITKATKIFQTSIVGLIIVVTAYSITVFVMAAVFKVAAPSSQVGASSGSSGGGFWSGFGSGFGESAKNWWNGL